ncbi:MAG: hypothetical protein Q4Q19_06270 [Methanobrevibacter sp.]|nr:hypothetical protein [Methanobrevibacter sp.]
MKDENENYEGYPDLDFLEDEDDGINKIIVVEVNDTTTDIFLETKKMAYIDNEVAEPMLPKGLVGLLVIHFSYISDGMQTPFDELEIVYHENINYVRKEYTVPISEHVNEKIRKTIEKDAEIIISIIPTQRDEIMIKRLEET